MPSLGAMVESLIYSRISFAKMMRRLLVLLLAAGVVYPAPPGAAEAWKQAMEAASNAATEGTRGRLLREALRTAQQFGDTDSRLLESLVELAAPCESDACNSAEQEKFLERALVVRPLAKPADWHLAQVLERLGMIAARAGRNRDALLCYRDAVQIFEHTAGPGDGNVARVLVAMAKAYQQDGDKTQARLTMDHALEARESAGAGRTEEFAALVEESANLFSDQDQGQRAQKEYERALAIREQVWGKGDSRYIDSMRNIATTVTWQSPAYAEQLLNRVVEASRAAEGDESEEHYQALASLAAYYAQHRRNADAERTYQKAYAVRESFSRGGDAEGARCLQALAAIRMAMGEREAAIEAASHSLAIHDTLPADPKNESLNVLALLAEASLETGAPADAERYYREFAQAARLKHTALLIRVSDKLSRIYQGQGDYARAAEKLEAAVASTEAASGGDSSELGDQLLRLAGIYERLGRPADAFRVHMRANQIAWARLLQVTADNGTGALGMLLLGLVAAAVALAAGAVGGYAWLERNLDQRIEALYPKDGEARPVRRVEFHGEGRSLFALRARNLMLTLLTLGVYAFWGRAAVRRYLFGQAEFEDDRLVFHGTGNEMLQGWLKGGPAVLLALLLPYVLPSMWRSRYALLVAQMIAVAAIGLLWPLVRAGAHRYRMNRMSWRGVRFGFGGDTREFQRMSFRGLLLTIATFGVYYPFFQVETRRYLFSHTWFGNRRFEFTGNGRDLVGAFLIALPLSILTGGLFWAWWSALRSRYFWAHTLFGGARFRCTATGAGLLGLWVTNALLVVGTLGVGLSWATVRSAQYWSSHVQMEGEPDFSGVQQEEVVEEPLSGFLGFDFGF